MAEIHEGVITDQDVGQEPAGRGTPEDPSRSSPESIVAKLVEPTGTAAGMSYGEEPPSSKSAALQAAEALTEALTVETAVADEAKSQLGLAEVQAALDRGLPADEVLAAGISSGVLSAEQADELAWNVARDSAGVYSDEDLDEVDGDDWALSEEIDEQQTQLLAAATELAQYELAGKQQAQASEAAFAQATANHEKSSAALKALQHELGLNGPQMRQHLAEIDAEVEGGLFGPQIDLDRLAQNDSELFSRVLHAASATLLESDAEVEAADIKQRILDQQHDIPDGLVVDGQRMKEPPQIAPFANEPRFVDRVSKRTQPGPYDQPVSLPPERRYEFTVAGRPTKIDDVPSEDGTTARSRHRESEKRGGRAS